MAKQTC